MTSTKATTVQQPIFGRIMDEHIRMAGFPQLIVTRGFQYNWLKDCGWPVCERGFRSLDYITFHREPVNEPLTDEADRNRMLAQVRDGYLRD